MPDGIDASFAQRYINSLIAKPFVILTGNSGTGKTRIAKQFSQYLERIIDGKRNWLIVPVGADWTDNTKMLGFYNPLEKKYVSTPTLDFILDACKNPGVPYFLILDEMNLSHVERYFSDFLSAMESDEEIPLYKISKDGDSDEELDVVIPESIRLPKNLFVTGTVNIDETTYMFSPKVLDRSNVVEFKPEKDDVLAIMTGASDVRNIAPADFGIAEGFTRLVPPAYMGNGAIANVIYIASQLVQINEALFVTSKYSIPETIDSINKMLKLELDEIGKTIKEFPDYAELYQDIMMIRSLNLITIDNNEYKSNIDLLEKFISKYGDSIVT